MNTNKTFRILLATAIIIGFFLPWFSILGYGASGLNIAMQNTADEPNQVLVSIAKYSFFLIPFFALIVLIRAASGQSSGFFLRLLPFLVTAILTALFIFGIFDQGGSNETLKSWLQILGVGFYITVIGSFLLIFV